MNNETAVETPSPVKKVLSIRSIIPTAAAQDRICGAYTEEMLAKMAYTITGNWNCGYLARKVWTSQIWKNSQTPLTADADEL